MITLLRKEIQEFFSSLIGYIVIIVFLLVNSLFMWVFKSNFNIIDNGYANIDTLFLISPWVFLFLIPSLTMRLFSEEKKSGTIELLFTRPISDLKIVLAKYFAGVSLVVFALIPTLVYFLSVYLLGDPIGNIDVGGVWGSYIGLFFLAAVYTSIGVFASSLTKNQVVAFIIAVGLSAFIYSGFDTISSLSIFKGIDNIIIYLGIASHYSSISRGVIDSRDLIYFIATISVFIFLTKMVLESRKWK